MMRNFGWSVLLMVMGLGWGCGSDPMMDNSTGVAGTSAAAGTGLTPGASGTTPGSAGTTSSGASGTGTGASGTGSGKAGTAATPPAGGTAATAAGTGAGTGATPTAGTGTAMAGMPAVAGMGAGGTGATMPPPMGSGTCGPATMISPSDLGNPKMPGPWTPVTKAGSGPSGKSTLVYPMDLGKGGVTHPVFHWGCGAASQPSQYADHLNLLASHGFVVIANASGSNPSKASLDWMLAENEKEGSMFYKKLDPNRVAMGGHSLGALETMGAAADPRIKTYILVCGGCMSGRGGCGAADIHAPSIFLGGEGEGGTTNFKGDYAEIKTSPSVFVTKTATDHIACARNNLGPWVAFMRWNLCGEEAQWKKEFMDGGTYCKSPWLGCMSKNL